MKKLILSIVAVAAFGFANAQKAEFGIKGGLHVSTFIGEAGNDSKAGFAVGGFGHFTITDKFCVQPEILYARQGAKDPYSSDRVHLDYINVPIMGVFNVNKEFNLEFGPQVGFLVASEATNGTVSVNTKELNNSVDFSMNFGLGYNISKKFSIGARYGLGLTNVFKTQYQSNAKNSVINLTVAFRL